MKELSTYTPTELLKLLNDTKEKHEQTKKEIEEATYQIDELEIVINDKIAALTEMETQYVLLIEEMDKR